MGTYNNATGIVQGINPFTNKPVWLMLVDGEPVLLFRPEHIQIDGDVLIKPQQMFSVLTAADAQTALADYFGRATALSSNGGTLVVGAPYKDNEYTDVGAVYTYNWNGSAWVQRGDILYAGTQEAGSLYGFGVAISGDGNVLAVGAYLLTDTQTNQGGVYIYDLTATGWVQRGGILYEGTPTAFAHFGRTVALSENGAVLIVGTPTASTEGRVYTYDWSGSAWVQRGTALTSGLAPSFGTRFGGGVALSADGNVLAVGAPNWPGTTPEDFGAVFVYDRSGSTWVQRGDVLESPSPASLQFYGGRVALSIDGAILAVTAPQWEGELSSTGAVLIYDWLDSQWRQRGSPILEPASFGDSVALSGDGSIMAVGDHNFSQIFSQQGGVYTFVLALSGWLKANIHDGTGWSVPTRQVLAANVGGHEMMRISETEIAANGNRITSVGEPTDDDDAATRAWVLANAGSGGGGTASRVQVWMEGG